MAKITHNEVPIATHQLVSPKSEDVLVQDGTYLFDKYPFYIIQWQPINPATCTTIVTEAETVYIYPETKATRKII